MKNLKNFGITFAVSIVILGIVALFACGYVADAVAGIFDSRGKELDDIIDKAAAETTPSTSEALDERFTRELKGESFTWLIVVTDKRTDAYDDYFPEASEIKDEAGILGRSYRLAAADAIALVRADVDTREYVIISVPSIMKLETGVGDRAAGEVYALYGIEYLANKLASMTGLAVDHYSVMNCTELAALAGAVGAIECELPVGISFNGKEYVTTPTAETNAEGETAASETKAPTPEPDKSGNPAETEPALTSELSPGTEKLSQKLQAALVYSDWDDGIEQETKILDSFVRGLLGNLSSLSDNSMKAALKGLKENIKETNIDEAAIEKCGETVRAYSWLSIKSVTYPGKLFAAGGGKDVYYAPDLTEAMELFYNYR